MPRRAWFWLLVFSLGACETLAGIGDRSVGESSPSAGGGSAEAGDGSDGSSEAGAGTGGMAGSGNTAGTSTGGASGSAGSADAGDADADAGSEDSPADAPDAATHGAHILSKSFGDAGEQTVRALAVDSSGDLILVGVFENTIDFGTGKLSSAGSRDYFVAKFDVNGNPLWSKRFGDSADQGGYPNVGVDASGNIVVVGDYVGSLDFGGGQLTALGSDIFAVKFDPQGQQVWSKRFGGTAPEYGVGTVDAAGNVYVCGHHDSGTIDFGGPPITNADAHADVLLAKLDPNGGHIWSKGFAAANANAFCSWVTVDANGDVMITGNMEGSLDLGGGPLSFGGFKDAYLAKLSGSDGSHVWSKSFGDSDWQEGKRIRFETDGTIVLCGLNWAIDSTPAQIDLGGGPLTSYGGAYVARFTPSGTHLSSAVFEGLTRAEGLAVDDANHIYLDGTMEQSADLGGGPLTHYGGWDVAVVEWAPGMQHVFSKSFGGPPDDYVAGLGLDPAHDVWLAGSFGATIDFGGGSLVTNGGADVFIAKLSP